MSLSHLLDQWKADAMSIYGMSYPEPSLEPPAEMFETRAQERSREAWQLDVKLAAHKLTQAAAGITEAAQVPDLRVARELYEFADRAMEEMETLMKGYSTRGD